jgi:hydrogenase maturation protease
MNVELVEKIADAVLYEGYMLYPYRASSVKNRLRFNWGALAPRSYSEAQHGTEAWEMQTQCLVETTENTSLNIKVRFLHLTMRQVGRLERPLSEWPEVAEPSFNLVPSLEAGGNLYQEWQEAVERDVVLPELSLASADHGEFAFSYPYSRALEPIRDTDGSIPGVLVRTQEAVSGVVEYRAEKLDAPGLFKLTVRIKNLTGFENAGEHSREKALLSSIVSTHTILSARNGEFVSLLDPPDSLREIAASCQNTGTYPVLAGAEGSREFILSSPIILYDYPEIAPESAGDLFDGTEIDEILTLRIMTLTDEEKREMRGIDDRAREILERTEMMPEEQLLKMHGALRGLRKHKGAANG